MSSALEPTDLGVAPASSSQLPLELVRRMAATLDHGVPLADGDALPPLWHWGFFAPDVPTAGLGVDGHPTLPADGPTADLPRRMWAGGRVRWLDDLEIGRPVERRSHVASIEEKAGRSGRLLIVTVHHDYSQNGATVVEEEQDLVYREPPPTGPQPDSGGGSGTGPTIPEGAWTRRRLVTEPMLARYSAVTFNAHRIHYDRPYALEVEGYPGLVVHGPLLATLLASAAVEQSGRPLGSIEYRGVAPAFCPDELVSRVEPGADGLKAAIHRSDGTLAMRAGIALRP